MVCYLSLPFPVQQVSHFGFFNLEFMFYVDTKKTASETKQCSCVVTSSGNQCLEMEMSISATKGVKFILLLVLIDRLRFLPDIIVF